MLKFQSFKLHYVAVKAGWFLYVRKERDEQQQQPPMNIKKNISIDLRNFTNCLLFFADEREEEEDENRNLFKFTCEKEGERECYKT